MYCFSKFQEKYSANSPAKSRLHHNPPLLGIPDHALQSSTKDELITTQSQRNTCSVVKTSEHQTESNWLFLPATSGFKVAQFLSSNYTPNFPNVGVFAVK